MHVLLKRQKTSVFLEFSPADSVKALKQRLSKALSIPPKEIKLLLKKEDGTFTPLEELSLIETTPITNESVAYYVLWQGTDSKNIMD
jgi:hypothetical protein